MNQVPSFIPEDLFIEFLSRLPAKNVAQYKTLCSSLYAIMSSSFFVTSKHLHQMKLQNNFFLLFQKEYGFWPLEFVAAENNSGSRRTMCEDEREFDILGSCNGLVLVCNPQDNFFLWNPSTTKCASIPLLPIVYPTNCFRAWVFFGLGYDAIMDDYKVIRVAMYHTLNFQNEVHVFSRNLGTWRRIGDFPFEYPLGMPGVYAKGRLHWQVSLGTDTYSIAYFDCSSETYGTMRISSDRTGYLRFYDLGSLDDETLIIYSSFCNSFENLKLWILTDYGNDDSWLRVIFAPGGPVVANQVFISAIQQLYLLKPDNRLMFFRIDPLGTFIRYDLVTGYFDIVHAPNVGVVEFCSVFRVVESLVSPFINE